MLGMLAPGRESWVVVPMAVCLRDGQQSLDGYGHDDLMGGLGSRLEPVRPVRSHSQLRVTSRKVLWKGSGGRLDGTVTGV